jgi:signal transduction histidine kinase
VGLTTMVFVVSGDTRASCLIGLQVFALLGTPVWWGISVRQQAEFAALASARADDLYRLAELRQHQAVRDERTRMAQDLHDALSSQLSTIAIHSSAALAVGADRPRGDSREEALGAIRKASVSALEDLRETILLLQTGADPIAPAAHLSEVDDLVASARATELDVELRGGPSALPQLAATVDHAAYRIVQESLTNAAKHAPGSRVVLSVRRDPLADAEGDRVLCSSRWPASRRSRRCPGTASAPAPGWAWSTCGSARPQSVAASARVGARTRTVCSGSSPPGCRWERLGRDDDQSAPC